MRIVLLILALSTLSFSAHAQEADPYPTRPSVMAGLVQWTLFGGGNLAGRLEAGRWVFEYSHGQGLDLNRLGGFALTKAERDADASVFVPWTTGGGVGYQITPDFHVLLEVKAHRFEVRGADRNRKLAYTTFSVGPGVFYDFYLYRGLFLQPNARFWPNVASTLDESNARLPRADGTTYEHESHSFGFFANVNLGWTFGRD
jgi:hypothetical protein